MAAYSKLPADGGGSRAEERIVNGQGVWLFANVFHYLAAARPLKVGEGDPSTEVERENSRRTEEDGGGSKR